LDEDDHNQFFFSSSLAKRFYFHSIFPNRSMVAPATLFDLVRGALQNMSAVNLRNATASVGRFPSESVFQHEFMAALAAVLPPSCYICPELSRVFPNNGMTEDETINGKIDFYINGDLRWGIELLVNGDRITEHLNRFSDPSGKYAPLQVKDYVVVDFRRTLDGKPTNVMAHEKRITVFFPFGRFTNCICIFGMNPAIENLETSS
jgi:hypothetical protein